MAENKNTDKTALTPAAKEPSDTAPASGSGTSTRHDAEPRPARGNGLLWLFSFFILLLLIAACGGAYWFVKNRLDDTSTLQTAQQQYVSQLAALNEQNQALQSQLSSLQDSKQQLSTAVTELTVKTRELATQSAALETMLKNQDGRRPADWLVAEADYLVKMAGRKLWLEQDVRTAIMLLVNADKRLKSLGDPSLLPVRAKLAADIQALQQLNPVSRTSVALAVSGMLAQVDKLTLDVFEKPETDTTSDNLSTSAADWKDNLAKVWRALVKDFFTVKTLSSPVAPVMSEQQRWLVREQLKLQLMQAQSAALASEAALFEQSLQHVQKLLVERFDIDDVQVAGFIRAVQNLLDTDISQPLPTELTSQQALEDALDTRVKQAFGQGVSEL
ncbi:uroporphyrinogen-III C-methyltransferase [Alteromonas sp. CYL-A6]|uniref:uroporphyrinogen-III C-methyltransferase n=1 Tax=Alteromonas nitratireducens TaxID=3390813 RepID=UPI0034AA950A